MKTQEMSEIEMVDADRVPSGLASFLRFVGSCLLLAGAIAYMLEGWYAVGHVSRYLKFLGVTGLLSTAGVLTALKLKENKGARTYLVLAAAAIPINFCQLGALLYSTMTYKNVPPNLTRYLLWEAPSLSIALTVAGVSVFILTGIAWLSFSVLGRQGRTLLVPAIIGLNSLLLLPVRSVEVVSILAIGAAIAAFEISRRLRTLHSFEYTLEGMYCRVLLWVPSAILLLRTAIIYDHSAVLNGVLCLYVGGIAIAGARVIESNDSMVGLLEFIGGSFVLTGILTEQHILLEAMGLTSARELIPVMAIMLTITAEVVSWYLSKSGEAIRDISYSIAAFLAVTFMIAETGSLAMATPLIVGGLGLLFIGEPRSRYITGVAWLSLVIGVVNLGVKIIPDLFDSWMLVSLLGVVVVFVGSLVEKGKISMTSHSGLPGIHRLPRD